MPSVPIDEADSTRGEADPSDNKWEDEDPGSPPRSLCLGTQTTKKTKRMRILLPQLPSHGETRRRRIRLPRSPRPAASRTGSHKVPPRWGRHDRSGRGYCNGRRTAVIPGGDTDGDVGRVIGGNMQDCTRCFIFNSIIVSSLHVSTRYP